ncbi:restriction endonuclease subunit S domain-containing protein [Mycoplasmopsis phocirhinis]|uniref:hypothetical protein n=1 Tax=Mycoplasmopsis phocirhinis TaxID=142650 RepID=UPI001E4AFBEA|nr:hypothetical protein [Mycoplasmopsis phocirhinis]
MNKNIVNNLYIFKEMLNKKLTKPISHKRHYIQETQFIKIALPSSNEQHQIYKIIRAIDQILSLLQRELIFLKKTEDTYLIRIKQ